MVEPKCRHLSPSQSYLQLKKIRQIINVNKSGKHSLQQEGEDTPFLHLFEEGEKVLCSKVPCSQPVQETYFGF